MEAKEPSKNAVSIRLSESVVFLKGGTHLRRHGTTGETPRSMLKGLLILQLVKPTRITSIELTFTGKSFTSWPEGIGARRIDVQESHTLFRSTTVFFKADANPGSTRRAQSTGPGVSMYPDHDEDSEPETPPRGRALRPNNDITVEVRSNRRRSVDPEALNTTTRTYPAQQDDVHLPPLAELPPYTPIVSPIMTPVRSLSRHFTENPAQALEESRNALRADLEDGRSPSASRLGSPLGGTAPASYSSAASSFRSLSRPPSIVDIPELDMETIRSPHERDEVNARISPSPSRPTIMNNNSSDGDDRRGRRNTRFNLASISNAFVDSIKDSVRSKSPGSRERASESRDRDSSSRRGRGRTLQRRSTSPHNDEATVPPVRKDRSILGRVSHALKNESEEHKEVGHGWKEFKKGTYTYPISFAIPSSVPPTLDCAYGSVDWKLKAVVHRQGAFQTKLTAAREIILIATPGEDDTEDTDSLVVERHWEDQMQYLIAISGRSFPIGGVIPINITLLPLAKIKLHRLSVYIDERVEYYTDMKVVARTDPLHRIPLLTVKSENLDGGPILPIDSDDIDAFIKSPLAALTDPDRDMSESAGSLMGPGPWSFQTSLELPKSCGLMHFSNRNKQSNIVIGHSLKVVFRAERGDDEVVDAKTGKRKQFDIVVQTPIQILSCRCNTDFLLLPRYSEFLDIDVVGGLRSCPCLVKRRRLFHRPDSVDARSGAGVQGGMMNGIAGGLSRISSRPSAPDGTSSPTGAETPTANQTLLRGADSLLGRNVQFERLVSGQEAETGEPPPSYIIKT